MRYAQIDAHGVCIADSHLAGVVDDPHMIPLGADDPTPLGSIWHDGQWIAPPPIDEPSPPRILTELGFRSRFTPAEKLAIYTAAESSVEVRIWLDDLRAAEHVDLDHPETVAGVQALEVAGLIGSGRAAQILETQ